MRKKVYEVLEALENGDWVSVKICKFAGISSRVRNEIYELRRIHRVRIITVESFIGRGAAYFLETSDANIKRVEMLLKTHEKKKTTKFTNKCQILRDK